MARFTFVLTIISLGTLYIISKQLDETKLEQRAWVAPVNTEIHSEPTKNGSSLIFVIPFSNTGKTPAINVHAWINRTADIQHITDYDPIDNDAGMIIAPGSTGNTSTADFPISNIDAEHVANGLKVYIYGTISYEDIFKKRHWTQFCFYPGLDLKSFGPCDQHNRTDDSSQITE